MPGIAADQHERARAPRRRPARGRARRCRVRRGAAVAPARRRGRGCGPRRGSRAARAAPRAGRGALLDQGDVARPPRAQSGQVPGLARGEAALLAAIDAARAPSAPCRSRPRLPGGRRDSMAERISVRSRKLRWAPSRNATRFSYTVGSSRSAPTVPSPSLEPLGDRAQVGHRGLRKSAVASPAASAPSRRLVLEELAQRALALGQPIRDISRKLWATTRRSSSDGLVLRIEEQGRQEPSSRDSGLLRDPADAVHRRQQRAADVPTVRREQHADRAIAPLDAVRSSACVRGEEVVEPGAAPPAPRRCSAWAEPLPFSTWSTTRRRSVTVPRPHRAARRPRRASRR